MNGLRKEAANTRVGVIVLSAGQSLRFRAAGGLAMTKLVEKLGGRSIVRMAAEAALASKARPVIVVTGHARSAVEAALAGLDVEAAHNPEYSSGIASSLKVGLSAMPADVAGALVLLGDMPWIEARLIDGMIASFLVNPRALAAAPTREGRRGNPVLLGRGLFEAALGLQGDEGARGLIDALKAGELVEVEAPDAGVFADIDTPGDLAVARRARSRKL
ncbi:MAG TPA: nucleotidyltransferase family protein [Roseiarcus sp.]